MSADRPLEEYLVEELCLLCEDETRKFREHILSDGGYCYEVFRRAIAERNDHCWQRLQDIYRGVVSGWCRRAASELRVDSDDINAFVWEKFWRNYGPEKLAQSDGTAAVLRYLKACAMSCLIDMRRERLPALSLSQALADSEDGSQTLGDILPDKAPQPEELATELSERESIWVIVNAEAKDEQERVLLKLKFRLDLSAAEIHAMKPDLFPNVADVYRVTRNLLDRLKRNPKIRASYD